MKQILFDANFKTDRFSEQVQLNIFKACEKIAPEYNFLGIASDKIFEEFSNNVDFRRIPFGKFDNLWSNIVIPSFAFSKKNNAIYFPCGNVPSLLPETTLITTMIKDVLPLELPNYFFTENDEKKYRRKIQTDINRSDIIFVPSEHIKQKITEEFLLLSEPVILNFASLIPEDYLNLPLARSNEKYFFVELDNVSPKGLNELLKIFIYSHMTGKSKIKLYLSGNLQASHKELLINMQVARKIDAIREYKSLTSGQRAALMRNAIAAILPSNNYVLPISHLDAMKCSCPVITDETVITKEICSDAVIYADMENTEQFISILSYIEQNEEYRKEYVYKGLAREKYFSWDNSAQTFLEKIELSEHN